ncbi:arf-GAP with GTPase, ANK repeat and PH domain-containing protein 1-like [Watersipora subatra]|uniref:arf-GAP with GTPase, ANK repeat and PH domain-containing protein 1-like n=1 Tax=Watersipora subatra TaxID=2589382 RepID=UPI00355C2B44
MSYQPQHQGFAQKTSYISNEIRQEIQRFESVHPSIYAIYDLIEGITDPNLQAQIRDHVVSIEDSFVNSQEWTTSRAVPDLKLGIVGLVNSGKSALVHRYLTGSYMQEESPEGGRFKKEVQIDGQSYLLLIRDEGGVPEAQFTNWIDVVILVFSVENEPSFTAMLSFFNKMCLYRDMSQVPVILVGTQDAIDSDSHPRLIDESRAKQLEAELGSRCRYYETCATYGLNVEHVFQDACQRAVQERARIAYAQAGRNNGTAHRSHSQNSGHYANPRAMFQQQRPGDASHAKFNRTDTPPDIQPQSSPAMREHSASHKQDRHQRGNSATGSYMNNNHSISWAQQQQMSPAMSQHAAHPTQLSLQTRNSVTSHATGSTSSSMNQASPQERQSLNEFKADMEDADSTDLSVAKSVAELTPMLRRKNKKMSSAALKKSNSFHGILDKKTTPNSTPQLARKNGKQKAIASIAVNPAEYSDSLGVGYSSTAGDSGTDTFLTPANTPSRARKSRRRSNLFVHPRKDADKADELGVGRTIPLKQGYLYKKGSKSITKDWKKKKYVILTSNGKLIYHPNMHDYMENNHGKEINLMQTTVKIPGQHKPRLHTQLSNGNSVDSTGGEAARNPAVHRLSPREYPCNPSFVPGHETSDMNTSVAGVAAAKIDSNTPHTRRKHRRAKSGSKIETPGDGNDSDGYEFTVVSLDNKQWQFEAPTQEERDTWVSGIEKQILNSLQSNDSRKSSQNPNVTQVIRNMPGNNVCCDCGAPDPAWASVNLGSVICMECSGIHRNLGTHHSRVRSLELDEWPPDLIAVMVAIGNQKSNSIWEAKAPRHCKPAPNSSREEKESWIRAKYELKEYLAERSHRNIPLNHLLIDAIARQEMSQVILLLANSTAEDVSLAYSVNDRRTPLHIAAQQANPVFLQLLLWAGADVKKLDLEGRSALWYAKKVGANDCAVILQSNGCQDAMTLPRARRGSLRTEGLPLADKHKDRSSLNSIH